MNAASLLPFVEGRYDEFVEALAAMVSIDCGTFSTEGVNRVADLCEARFRSSGWEVERMENQPKEDQRRLGDIVIGRIGDGPPHVLLIGHMDTVFPDGTASERPFRVDGDRAYGPGAADMKGGLLAGFFAVDALREAGVRVGTITYVCNPDEEIGSIFSRDVIGELSRESDTAFVLEAARENGNVVSRRKGVSDFRIEILGRAAHAGVEPEKGRSAVLEAAHKTLALHELNHKWPGVTVNVGVIEGGTRPNVVAERCMLHVDLRAPTEDAMEAAEREIVRIGEESTVPATRSRVRVSAAHRPMEKSEGSGRLVEMANEIAQELGFDLRDTATGGASDANTTAAAGVPTLDGLGPIGGGAHSADEWLDLSSVVPRVTLLAGLISRVVSEGGPRH